MGHSRRFHSTEAVNRLLSAFQRCEHCRVGCRLSNQFYDCCLKFQMLVFITFVGSGEHAVSELLIISEKTRLVCNSSFHFQRPDFSHERPTALVETQSEYGSPRVRIGFKAAHVESFDRAVLDIPRLPCFGSGFVDFQKTWDIAYMLRLRCGAVEKPTFSAFGNLGSPEIS